LPARPEEGSEGRRRDRLRLDVRPRAHRDYGRWPPERVVARAGSVGPYVRDVATVCCRRGGQTRAEDLVTVADQSFKRLIGGPTPIECVRGRQLDQRSRRADGVPSVRRARRGLSSCADKPHLGIVPIPCLLVVLAVEVPARIAAVAVSVTPQFAYLLTRTASILPAWVALSTAGVIFVFLMSFKARYLTSDSGEALSAYPSSVGR
jgi:hypothetical protein